MSALGPRRVARNAGARAAGELIAKLSSLAFFVAMARELGKNGLGEYQFALALTGALAYLAGFGTDDLLAREVARDRSRARRLLGDAAALKLLGGLAMLGVAVVVVNVGEYSDEARAVVYVVGVGSLLEVLSKSWFGIFQGHERLDLAAATLIIQRTATAVVGIAVLVAGGGVLAAAFVYAGGALLAVVTAEAWMRRLGVRRASARRGDFVPLMRAALPIGLITLLGTLLLRVDVLMVSFFGDAAKVGVYAVAFRLVEATRFLGTALAAAMLPWLARAERHGETGVARGYALGMKAITALLMPIGLTLVLFARPIIDLLYGASFEGAVLPLRLLGMMALLFGINALAATLLIARDRPATYAWLLAPVIALNVGLNLVLIPRYGPDGAAFDALISGVLLAGLGVWQAGRATGSADLLGAFAGPVLAGVAMAAVVVTAQLPWPLEAGIGWLVYAVVLGGFEWVARRDDARVYLSAVPLGSRVRAGRTAA